MTGSAIKSAVLNPSISSQNMIVYDVAMIELTPKVISLVERLFPADEREKVKGLLEKKITVGFAASDWK